MFAVFTWYGIHEADVALTDFALFLECFIFALLLLRAKNKSLRYLFITFFVCTGIAALLGGLTHGFFYVKGSLGHSILWRGTLFSIIFTSWSLWMLSVKIGVRECEA